jgi:hypothetical protein
MSKQPTALLLADACDTLGNLLLIVPGLDTFECAAELRRQHALIEELKKAVRNVLSHRHDTPTTGYLRDNGASRDALSDLAAVLAKAEAQS